MNVIDFLNMLTLCLVAYLTSPSCLCCNSLPTGDTCGNCLGSAPQFITATFSGMALTKSSCDGCHYISGKSFICEQLGGPSSCTWTTDQLGCVCGAVLNDNKITITLFGGATYLWFVTVKFGSDTVIFQQNVGASKPNCITLDQVISYSSGGGTECNGWSSITLTLTATVGPVDDGPGYNDCDTCNVGTTPISGRSKTGFDVTLNGISDNGCTCSPLDGLTVFCAKVLASSAGCCVWRGSRSITCGGGGGTVLYEVSLYTVDQLLVRIYTPHSSITPAATFSASLSSPVDCDGINETSMAYASGDGTNNDCAGLSTATSDCVAA